MGFVPAANTLQIELIFSYFGVTLENVLYAQKSTSIVDADFPIVGSAVVGWWAGSVRGSLVNQISLTEVYMTNLTTQTAPANTFTAGLPQAGLINSPGMPGPTTLCVSIRTNGRGKSSRGRNYISGLSETAVSGNDVSSVTVDDLADAYNAFRASLPAGWTHVVVSRRLNKADRPAALVQPVTACLVVDAVVDSQRGRKN